MENVRFGHYPKEKHQNNTGIFFEKIIRREAEKMARVAINGFGPTTKVVMNFAICNLFFDILL